MAKFHIGKDGTPSKCTAIKGKCPFGDESHHYNSIKEAKKSLEEKLSIEKNVFSSFKKEEKTENDNIKYIISNLKEISNIIKEKEYNLCDVEKQDISTKEKENVFNILAKTDKKTVDKVISYMFEERIKEKYNKKDYELYKDFINKVVNCEDKNTVFNNIDKIKNIENIDYIINNNFKRYKSYSLQYGFYKDVKDNGYSIKYAKELTSGLFYLNIENVDGEQKSYLVHDFTGKGIEYNNFSMLPINTDFEKTYIPYDGGISTLNIDDKNNILRYGLSVLANDYKNNTIAATYKMFTFASLTPEENSFLKKASIEASINNKETYLQRKFPNIPIELSDNNDNYKNFQVGISKVKEYKKSYATRMKNTPEIAKKINELKSKKGYGNMQGTKNEREIAINTLETMDKKDIKKIIDYSGTSYRDYSGYVYGYTKRGSMVREKDIDNINNIIKQVSDKSISRKRFLYRGASVPDGSSVEDYLKSFNSGDVFITNRITSTSRSGKVANTFGNNDRRSGHIKFIYYTSKGAYVAPISKLPNEEEVLLPIGEKIVCIDKGYDKSGKAYVIFADEDNY